MLLIYQEAWHSTKPSDIPLDCVAEEVSDECWEGWKKEKALQEYAFQCRSAIAVEQLYIFVFFFSSGVADHALRLGPYMRISYYRENFNMDTGGRMRIGKS